MFKIKDGNINKSLRYYILFRAISHMLICQMLNQVLYLVFLKAYNIGFDDIIIMFIDQNGRPLEIEDKVSLISLINK